ncbi:M1-specific T cell receptor alpha chain-like [Melospiza georgiana]|uniref:M1-specific T cell receptor alpha chain-like n=1 Tax=Melospiza georgiana TaxID=44398 RepID=UPI0025AC6AAA|nr:M1-specific T cell receptor alpha chain-like [Melospiza georgiana]
MQLAYLILTVFLGQLLGTTGQDTVTQEHGPVLVKQGHPFHTTCKYQASYFTALLWYQLRKGEAPELISYQAGAGSKRSGRFTTQLNTTGKSSVLQLEEVELSDSALYLCALQDTLVQGTAALVFGNGTQLTVEPNVLKTSDPQVIVMKSKKLEEDGSSGKAACLARNSTTKNIRLEMPSQEVVYEQSPSILTSQGLYNAIKVVRVTKDTEVTCTAKFDDLTMTAQPEEEAEEPITGFGEPNSTRTESGASERVCNSTNISAQDAGGQRVNMLSMAVLGLRVLLAKSIAFNALMSIKLFLF